MTTHSRNLCTTVENYPRYETLRCTVTRRQKPPYQHQTTNYHEWSDHNGGTFGGICVHCGKTLKDVRVRINPKTGKPVSRGGIAREIAATVRDVPPVLFVGRA